MSSERRPQHTLRGSRQSQRKVTRRPSTKSHARADGDPRELAMLQPWFLPLEIAYAVKQLIPREYLSRMRWMFEDFGCILCGTKSVRYGGNGFCRDCRWGLLKRMIASMKKRFGSPEKLMRLKPTVQLIDSAVLARKLLADLVSARSSVASYQKGHDKKSLANPTPSIFQRNPPRPLSRQGALSSIALSQIRVFKE